MDTFSAPQSHQLDRSQATKLRVFISYSRDDLKFADQLDAGLVLLGFESVLDRHGIAGGEDWKRRLGGLIREADTVVVVLSPASAQSDICAWEVEEATRLGKRIVPVLCRSLEGTRPPPRLEELNYIFFYDDVDTPGSGFGTGLTRLAAALRTDFDWTREHTRLLARATDWETKGRQHQHLLSGTDIAEAKAWAGRRPKGGSEVTPLLLDYIRSSEEEAEARSNERRRQLEAMAAAQEERAKALSAEEAALKQAAEAQRKRARARNIAFAAVSIAAVVIGLLGWHAESQRAEAVKQKAVFERTLDGVMSLIAGVSKRHALDRESLEEIAEVLTPGAEQGYETAMFNLGLALYEGRKDYVKAREWYEKAAAKDHVRAMNNLGLLYLNGEGIAQDPTMALEWFQKAAGRGHDTAMVNLGVLYENGQGVTQDYLKASEWYEKAAGMDNPGAMFNLGALYENGQGVAKDYAKAREWYEKAAAKDHTGAMLRVGLLYHSSEGVPPDYLKAREWYEKAAAKGDADAMVNLGVLYENGQGVSQDYLKAREWYEKAAAKGDADAMTSVGALFQNGQGGAKDYAKAFEWYEKAADLGNAIAMRNLGVLFHDGVGVTQSFEKAREWYEKAAAKDDPDAKSNLERLPIDEAFASGRYAEALKLQTSLTARTEDEETKSDGKPGVRTGAGLNSQAWHALFARDFTMALAASDRARALLPDDLVPEGNKAHALMFLGHQDEAKTLYLAHRGKPLALDDVRIWEKVVAEDFAQFRKAGLTHPMMDEIERELGLAQ